ncbi:MAG: DNA-binding protein [Pseudohongiellaceae bacterium]
MTRNVRETHNKYLRDPEFAAMYLSEALEEGNPAVIRMALRNIAEAQKEDKDDVPAQTQLRRETMEELLSETSDSKLVIFPKAIHELGFKLKVEAYQQS